jgi:hypothetical protein
VSPVLKAGGDASMTGIAVNSSGTHRCGGAACLMTRFMTVARARAFAAATCAIRNGNQGRVLRLSQYSCFDHDNRDVSKQATLSQLVSAEL